MSKYLLRLSAEQVQLLCLCFRFPQDHLTCRDTEYLSGRLSGEGRASQEAAPRENPRTREGWRGALPCAGLRERGSPRSAPACPRGKAPRRGRGMRGRVCAREGDGRFTLLPCFAVFLIGSIFSAQGRCLPRGASTARHAPH